MPDKIDKAIIAITTVSGVVTATGVAMTGLGFGTGGIVATSIVSGVQAGIGNVAASSAFAIAQSMGATGVYVAMGTAGGIGLAIGAGYGTYKLVKH